MNIHLSHVDHDGPGGQVVVPRQILKVHSSMMYERTFFTMSDFDTKLPIPIIKSIDSLIYFYVKNPLKF